MSPKLYVCIAFSFVNAVTAFVISWLMQARITTFDITAFTHGWDMPQKTEACRSAGVLYLILGACFSAYALYLRYATRAEQLRRYEMELAGMPEGTPLLRGPVTNGSFPQSKQNQGATGPRSKESYGADSSN
ncbi:uncharacterized protein TEOVI_000066500 [Trypanosoma equiperdum]|uniref:Uncharacterized protein n=3 Tax=Trypanozoon TaxID=39700 RepID=Q584H0_TRYB2|nr:hypothetical protein, conserved [Trypanosoma brucei brucei TREU927]AAX79035.1 hypothetical protein, conserved [Trypanosoma brucei]AAZ10808.1 hypothetical protein, conserved [Trypanosoma brucei brucei TREU927]SCU69108.1 hypothetical protein, conserved [Trypanosoma equiperdum]